MTTTTWALLAAVAPSPTPTEGVLRPGIEETDVSPGLVGFLVTFALVLGCIVLFISMSRHLRRTRQNAEVRGMEVAQNKGIGIQRTTPPPVVPADTGDERHGSDSADRSSTSDGTGGGTAGGPSPDSSPSPSSSPDSGGGGGGA